jgi:hypothetical protein
MTTLGSSQILQNGYWSQMEQMSLDANIREQGQSNIAFIAKLLDQYDDAVSQINQNGDLSAKGRASEIMAKSKLFFALLKEQTDAVMAGLTAQISSNSKALEQAARGPDATVVNELRAREVREWFATVDPILRPSLYEKLIREGNTAAALAIECAPGLALLDLQTITEGRELRSSTLMPKEAFVKQSAIEIKDILTASIRFAVKHLSVGTTNDPLQLAPILM